MSRKHFSTLLIATLVAVLAVALLLPGQTGRDETGGEPRVLLPGLSDWVNDATRVEVVGPDDGVTLVRGDAGWLVDELAGYPADFERLRALLAGLARAEVTEWKTDNPAYYDRLGVQDVEAEGATGVRVTVSDGAGEDARRAAVILGDAPQGRSGVFVREAGEARSALVGEDLDAPARPTDWVNRDLLDVPSAEVAEVAIRHPDGETVTVRKISADETDYTLVELPEGRAPKSAWSVNSIANAFAALRFDDVRPASDIDWSEPLAVTVLTFDGRRYALELVTVDDTHWMRIDAGMFEATADAGDATPAAGEGAEDTEDGDGGAATESDEAPDADTPADPVQAAVAAVAEQVAGEDARFEGWAYAVPAYKYDPLNKRLEDLLAEPDDGNDAADAGP